MFIFRMIRKVFSLFRSGLTAHEISLGFCIGILAGCIPFSSVWALAAVILLMVVFRASFTSFLLAVVVVKLLGFVVVPICYKLGGFALDGPLSGLFGAMANTPVLALLDLHRYVVAGGILFAILASVVVYPLLYVLVNRYRKSLIAWSEKSPRYKKITENVFVRFIGWIFIGKKGDYAGALEAHKSPIRKGVVITIACFIVVTWLFGFFFGDAVAKAGFEGGMSAAFDADVTLADAGLSFIGGSLEMDDLLMVERDRKGKISSALLIRGDLNVAELLRRRFVIEELALESVSLRAARDKDGNFNLGRKKKRKREKPPEKEEPGKLPHLGDLWEKKELGRDIVEKVLEWIFPEDDPEAREKERREKKDELEDLSRYTDIYADHLIDRDQPLVVIEKLAIKGLDLMLVDEAEQGEPDVFEGLILRATNLSSNPLLYGKDSIIELFGGAKRPAGPGGEPGHEFSMKLTLKWSEAEPGHLLTVRFDDIPAQKAVGRLSAGGKVEVEDGVIRLDSETRLSVGSFICTNNFELKNMTFRPGKKGGDIAGLDADKFCKLLNKYMAQNPLPLEIGLDGPYTSPSVDIDEKELLRVVQEGIADAGVQMIEDEADKVIQKGQDKLDEEIDKGIKKGTKELGEEVRGLFGGDDDDEDKDKKKKKKSNKNKKGKKGKKQK